MVTGRAPDERRVVRANAKDGAFAQAVTMRQRASEVATSGSAPPAAGRRGSAANVDDRSGCRHERARNGTSHELRSTTSRPKLSRRKTVMLERGNGSANCTPRERESAANEDATSCRKRGVEARSGRTDRNEGRLRGSPASKCGTLLRGRLGQPMPPSSFLSTRVGCGPVHERGRRRIPD